MDEDYEEMLLCAESAFTGTWGGAEPLPQEVTDFLTMQQMRWSWDDLEATPVYVRRYVTDLLEMQARARKAKQKE